MQRGEAFGGAEELQPQSRSVAEMIKIDVRKAMAGLTRDLDRLQREQVPYAAALALTATARDVAEAETKALAATFKTPTSFTLRGVGVIGARKSTLTARVFMKDIQAAYLDPYEGGGRQVLGGKQAILTPRDLPVNAYGNIPRGKLQALKGRPDIFIGEVKTKSGMVGGVWQRVDVTRKGTQRRKAQRGRAYHPVAGRLKLLIQFTRPAMVTRALGYQDRARAVVDRRLPENWRKALAQALASAQ